MYVTIKNSRLFFSDDVIQRENLKEGDYIFLFKIRDKDEFGFHKADEEFSKVVECSMVKKDRLNGNLYIQPASPPAGLITALLRIGKDDDSKLPVELLSIDQLVIQTPIYKISKA